MNIMKAPFENLDMLGINHHQCSYCFGSMQVSRHLINPWTHIPVVIYLRNSDECIFQIDSSCSTYGAMGSVSITAS